MFILTIGVASAFVPRTTQAPLFAMKNRAVQKAAVRMEDTYWEGNFPPSNVLGPVLSKTSSGVLGISSLLALGVGSYGLGNQIQLTSQQMQISPLFCALTILIPISWGLHVASWIQKENGK